ncbi:MAG TPA: CHASE2 domain-containing protein, partial [Anaerolineae bacterium]|nr:CHASE2 domain-containing protein [Anaerolineae bacterium]
MKKKSVPRKKFLQDFLLVILILCFFIVLSLTGALDYLNWKFLDVLVVHQKSVPEYRDNVVIVCIDQNSIDFYDKNRRISWPWPREFYGYLLRYLADCGARAVFFDIIFSEQDIDRTYVSGEESDNEFASAIEETGIAYLAVSGQDAGNKESLKDDSRWVLEEKEQFQKFHSLPSFKSALYPIPKFMHGARGMGLVNLLPENDGIHRRYPLV